MSDDRRRADAQSRNFARERGAPTRTRRVAL